MHLKRLLSIVAATMSLGVIAACQQHPPPPPGVTKVSTTVEVACGSTGDAVPVDWYFPADAPKGLVWLQHGFVESKDDWADFAPQVAAEGYLAMATTLPSTDPRGCNVQDLGDNGPFLDNLAALFAGIDRPSSPLGTSHAEAAGLAGRSGEGLPQALAFSGHSAGGETVLSVADRLRSSYPSTFAELRGLVLQDPVKSFAGTNTDEAVANLNHTTLPIYTLASPPSPCNADQSGTQAVIAGLTTRSFFGAQVTSGVHGDIFGPAQGVLGALVCGLPQAENTAATQTLTLGWFGDWFAGSRTPAFYPGGSTYDALVAGGTITTLP